MSARRQVPVSALFDSLFKEAEAGKAPVWEKSSRLSGEQGTALLVPRAESRPRTGAPIFADNPRISSAHADYVRSRPSRYRPGRLGEAEHSINRS